MVHSPFLIILHMNNHTIPDGLYEDLATRLIEHASMTYNDYLGTVEYSEGDADYLVSLRCTIEVDFPARSSDRDPALQAAPTLESFKVHSVQVTLFAGDAEDAVYDITDAFSAATLKDWVADLLG